MCLCMSNFVYFIDFKKKWKTKSVNNPFKTCLIIIHSYSVGAFYRSNQSKKKEQGSSIWLPHVGGFLQNPHKACILISLRHSITLTASLGPEKTALGLHAAGSMPSNHPIKKQWSKRKVKLPIRRGGVEFYSIIHN